MDNGVWIAFGLLVLAAGACWEAVRLTGVTRRRRRRTLRERRVDLWRRKREEAEALESSADEDEAPNDR